MPAINQPVKNISDKLERNRRIVVIGEALLDHFPDGAIPGGSPFNVARHLAALGAAPVFITRIGQDADADIILKEFARFGMSTIGVQRDAERPTGFVTITLSPLGHQFHISENQAWDAIDARLALAVTEQTKPDIICINTLAQRSAISKCAVKAVVDSGIALRVLDLNLRDGADSRELAYWSLRNVDVLKVNEHELAQLLHWFVDSSTPDIDESEDNKPTDINGVYSSKSALEAILQLLRVYPLKRLMLTRGADGYLIVDSLGHIIAEGKAPIVDVVDTVGAGDAFLAVMLLGESLGWAIDTTSARAAQFAAAVCTHRGAVTNNLSFYETWREQWQLANANNCENLPSAI